MTVALRPPTSGTYDCGPSGGPFVSLTPVVAPRQFLIDIVDPETNHEITVAPTTTVVEGDTARIALTMSPPSQGNVVVGVFGSDTPATATDDVDFTAPPVSVAFARGQNLAFVDVPTVDDSEVEPTENFFLTFDVIDTGGMGAFVVPPGEARVNITDNDSATPITITALDPPEITEGDEGTQQAVFTVQLSEALQFPNPPSFVPSLTVEYTTVDGSAVAGEDYETRNGTLTFTPTTGTELQVMVPVNGDEVEEDDEEFFFELSNPSSGTLARARATAQILNDDGPDGGGGTPLDPIEITMEPRSIDEGDSGPSTMRFVVQLSRAPTIDEQNVRLGFATRNGTATLADNDYQALNGSMGFQTGSSLTAEIPVTVNGDLMVEADEDFFVDLDVISGNATVLTPAVRGVIRNDDVDSVRFTRRRTEVREGAGVIAINLERVGLGTAPLSVLVTPRNRGAREGADYQATEQRIQWGAGDLAPKTFEVTILDDDEAESEEGFELVLSAPDGGEVATPARHQVTISDDEFAATIAPITDQETGGDGGSVVGVGVQVAGPQGQPLRGIAIRWRVAEGQGELLDGEQSTSDASGVARNRVRLPPDPGVVMIGAEVVGGDSEVLFELLVTGLITLFPDDPEGGPAALAEVLDNGCAESTGSGRELCRYLVRLPDGDARSALQAMNPDAIASLGVHSLQAQLTQLRLFGERLAALRRGERIQVEQLAFDFNGKRVDPWALATALAQGPAASPDKKLAKRLDAILSHQEQEPAQDEVADELLEPFQYSERWGFFLNGRYSTGDRDTTRRESGFDFDTWALTVGVDYRLNNRFVLGAALNHIETDTTLVGNGGGLNADGAGLSLYGSLGGERYFWDFVASYGSNSYDLVRAIDLPQPFVSADPALDGRRRFEAEGSTDGDQLSATTSVGYDLIQSQWSLSGFARGYFFEGQVDRYTESGAGPFSLLVEDQDLESLLGEVGLELSYSASVSWGVLQPSLRASYFHEFEDGFRLIRGRFAVVPEFGQFAVPTDGNDQNFFNLGLALQATLPGGNGIFLGYDTDLERDNLSIDTLTGGFRLAF